MGARLDQHFLVDTSVRDAILLAAELQPSDSVVEIGPGKGVLTEKILERVARLTAVELDARLAENMARRFADKKSFRLIQRDFLKLDLAELGTEPVKFVANLPYAVATPILQRILAWPHWTCAVLMFQKEVAERIVAGPGGPDYGLLTLSVKNRAEASLIAQVGCDSFRPRPQVGSAVVLFKRLAAPLAEGVKEKRFFNIAKAAFSQRRKMASGLIAGVLGIPRDTVVSAMGRCGVAPTVRAQEIPVGAFLKLADSLTAFVKDGNL